MGSTVTDKGFVPAVTGEPAVASAPPVWMVYAETLFEPKFAAKANLPAGSTVTDAGLVPAATGEPTLVSAPVLASILYAETSFEP